MTDTDLRNKIARLLDIRGLMGSRQIEEVTPFLLALIHEREREAKLEMLILLEDVINNTPTDKNNMEYFVELHKQELKKGDGL